MPEQLEADSTLANIENLLREATCELDGNWSMVGSGNAPATYSGGISLYGATAGVTSLWGRDCGRYMPYYQHEYQLRAQRQIFRRLGTFTAISVGALQALQVYVMGGEWEYEAVAKSDEDVPDDFIAEVNCVVKQILDKNDFIGALDNEIHDASREDGESLVALYAAPDGICDIRRLDADNLRTPQTTLRLNQWLGTDWSTPAGNPAFDWNFGVLTGYDERMKRIDHSRALGYHVVFEESGREFDFLPAWPMQGSDLCDRCGHLVKRNAPATAKRGVSDFFPVVTDLEREDKINGNLSVVTAALAAIAWIETMPPGTTREKAESSLTNAIDDFSRALAANKRPGDTRMVNRLSAGSVPKVSAGRTYNPPPISARGSGIFIDVRQAILRRIETRWLMPEYMITADASNANYASTLISGTPFIKAREGEQSAYKREFREIIFKALKLAHDAARFRSYVRDWASFVAQIDLVITPPAIATEDKKTLLEQLFGSFEIGVMDANEVRVALRLEPKEELEGVTGTNNSANPPPMPIGRSGLPRLAVNFSQNKKLESLAAKALKTLSEGKK